MSAISLYSPFTQSNGPGLGIASAPREFVRDMWRRWRRLLHKNISLPAALSTPDPVLYPTNVIQFGRSLCMACRCSTPESHLSECYKCEFKFCNKCDTCRCDIMPPISDLLAMSEAALQSWHLIDRHVGDALQDEEFALSIKDEAGRYVYVSDSLAKMFGSDWRDMKGKMAEDLPNDDHLAARVSDADTYVLRHRLPAELLVRHNRHDYAGDRRLYIRKCSFDCGTGKFIVTTCTDVTDNFSSKSA